MTYPTLTELTDELFALGEWLHENGIECTDVRIQCRENYWQFHSGDACFDQDHHGYWGASAITANEPRKSCVVIARELIEEAKEAAACSGEEDEETMSDT